MAHHCRLRITHKVSGFLELAISRNFQVFEGKAEHRAFYHLIRGKYPRKPLKRCHDLSTQVFEQGSISTTPLYAFAHQPLLCLSFLDMLLNTLMQLRVVLDPREHAVQHRLSLFFHRVRVSKLVHQVFVRA